MAKTDVYSWRLSPDLKAELEEAARETSRNLATLLEEIAEDWLAHHRARAGTEDDEQRSVRAAAMKTVGAIHGGDPHRAESARETLRARLAGHREGSSDRNAG